MSSLKTVLERAKELRVRWWAFALWAICMGAGFYFWWLGTFTSDPLVWVPNYLKATGCILAASLLRDVVGHVEEHGAPRRDR